MTRVHLVYPHGPGISTPQAIGRKVGERLCLKYDVRHYDWDDTRVVKPNADDVLIGHPHPAPWTIFRRSAKRRGWRRVIALSPYNHGDTVQVAFADGVIRNCDLYLAITGNYWFRSIPQSVFSHWLPKMVHLDLAVDQADFPPIKRNFNPAGKRKFLYVGHSAWCKNTCYLGELARAMPEATVSWMGNGKKPIAGVMSVGGQDFRTQKAKDLVRQHDFMLTVGKADSNPTTILEAMAWGLIPVCTRESGYLGYPGIPNVPLGNVRRAVEVLRQLQYAPAEALKQMQALNYEALENHFNWDRFTCQVVEAIESDTSPEMGPEPLSRKLTLRWAALISPYSVLRPSRLMWSLRKAIAPGGNLKTACLKRA